MWVQVPEAPGYPIGNPLPVHRGMRTCLLVQAFLARLDRLQQRVRAVAIGYGVVKKFSDDNGGNLCALMTYYGFVSLFPLLLVLVTVLGYVLADNADLQRQILDSAFARFPIVGDQLQANVHSLHGHGVVLLLGVLGTLYGGLGIANVSQHAMNRIWAIPFAARPGFWPRLLRSLAVLSTFGLGLLVTTLVSGIAAGRSIDLGLRAGVFGVALVANFVLFMFLFQILVARHLEWRDLWPGAIVASVAWEVLQALGGLYVARVVQGASQVYGLFALVFGLFAWFSLLARVVLYSAELNAVRALHLWPRAIAAPFTIADAAALELYAQMQVRRAGERIDVELPQ